MQKHQDSLGSKSHNSLVVQVSSAGFAGGNLAEILVNDLAVKCKMNENGHQRGLHVVVIDAETGEVETAQVFDTYQRGVGFDEFIETAIPEGRIIAAACKDECVTQLSTKAKHWFANMGSKEIWNLKRRQGFAFISKMEGSGEVSEARSEDESECVSASQVFKLDDAE